MKRPPPRAGRKDARDRPLRLVPPIRGRDAAHGEGTRAPRDVEIVYGLRAALAVCAARPSDVVSMAYAGDVAREAPGAIEELRALGIRTRELPLREIERIAQSAHHEGVVVEARPRRWASAKDVVDLVKQRRGACLALDRVRNSYNVGAIVRSAAFFGVDAVLLGSPAPHPGLDPNAVRVAEGGAEHVVMARTTDLADTLGRFGAAGVAVVGADGHATTNVADHTFARPTVLVLGNEREGLAPRVRAACERLVAIRGAGSVESLNVAVAAGILLSRVAAR